MVLTTLARTKSFQMEHVHQSIKNYIAKAIRTIPDFPQKGIQFKDITTLLQDKRALELTSYMLSFPFKNVAVDYVVGLESRGFLFGTNLAKDLNAGFIPVRKPGKLPSDTLSETYALEYGNGQLEIHEDAIFKGANVIIHDDLIATGGTAAAATRLIERLGGEVLGYSFIIELSFLNGRKHLNEHASVESIILE